MGSLASVQLKIRLGQPIKFRPESGLLDRLREHAQRLSAHVPGLGGTDHPPSISAAVRDLLDRALSQGDRLGWWSGYREGYLAGWKRAKEEAAGLGPEE